MRYHLGLALALAATAAFGQSPVDSIDASLLAKVEKRLKSERAADVAWGGYLAHRYRLRVATGALSDALRRWQKVDELEARFVRMHLVDGLVGAGARVPSDLLMPLMDDPLTRHGALAVMAADVRSHREAIRDIALAPAPHNDIVRRTAGRVLAARDLKSKQFAKYVASNLEPLFKVRIKDDNPTDEWNSAIGLGGGGPPGTKALDGFPPLVKLRLVDSAKDTRTVRLVVPDEFGDKPIVLVRRTVRSFQPYELRLNDKQKVQSQHELASLASRMSGVRFKAYNYLQHDWQGAEAYVEEVGKARDAHRAKLDEVLAGLREKGWLTRKDLPDYRIPLKFIRSDLRGDKSTELPKLPPMPAANGG